MNQSTGLVTSTVVALLDRELQTHGEEDRRWPPPLQRPDELHPGARQDREVLLTAAHRLVQEMETVNRQR